MKKSKKNLLIVYLVAAGEGISGGTRIHVECTKKWLEKKTFKSVTVWASDDGYRTCTQYGVEKSVMRLMSTTFTKGINFWVDYIWRTMKGIWLSLFFKLEHEGDYYIYAASDFWADFFPALIIHFRYKNRTKLLSPIYLFAPRPGMGYDGKPIFSIKLIIYYLMQQVMMWFARRFSDAIFVTYSPDMQRLERRGFKKQPQFVVVGGIEFDKTIPYVKKKKIVYDAVYVGRYHPQKGIFYLLRVWKLVVEKKPKAKLAILGTGEPEFEKQMIDYINDNKLQENIALLGFMDGDGKYELFSRTRMYLNTNLYDAGGMATMEAMSCGLPVVSWDFRAARSMIGDGVLWAKYLDEKDFARQVIKLITDTKKVSSLGKKAREDMRKYDWEKTAKRVSTYFDSI